MALLSSAARPTIACSLLRCGSARRAPAARLAATRAARRAPLRVACSTDEPAASPPPSDAAAPQPSPPPPRPAAPAPPTSGVRLVRVETRCVTAARRGASPARHASQSCTSTDAPAPQRRCVGGRRRARLRRGLHRHRQVRAAPHASHPPFRATAALTLFRNWLAGALRRSLRVTWQRCCSSPPSAAPTTARAPSRWRSSAPQRLSFSVRAASDNGISSAFHG